MNDNEAKEATKHPQGVTPWHFRPVVVPIRFLRISTTDLDAQLFLQSQFLPHYFFGIRLVSYGKFCLT